VSIAISAKRRSWKRVFVGAYIQGNDGQSPPGKREGVKIVFLRRCYSLYLRLWKYTCYRLVNSSIVILSGK